MQERVTTSTQHVQPSANEIQSDVSLGPRGAEHDKNTLTACAPICLLPLDSHRGTRCLICGCVFLYFTHR